MGENTDALITIALLGLNFLPAAILLNSVPEEMLNWEMVYIGGVFYMIGLFGLVFMANKKWLIKKRAELVK